MSHAGVDGLSMHNSTNDYRDHRGLVAAATHWGHTSDARAVLAVSTVGYLRFGPIKNITFLLPQRAEYDWRSRARGAQVT